MFGFYQHHPGGVVTNAAESTTGIAPAGGSPPTPPARISGGGSSKDVRKKEHQKKKKRKKDEVPCEATAASRGPPRQEERDADHGEGATAEVGLLCEERKEKRERRHSGPKAAAAASAAGGPLLGPSSAHVEDVGHEEEEEAEVVKGHHHQAAAGASLEAVPTEVLYLILGRLAPHDLCRVALVCQRWYDAVADDFLWQNIHLALIGPCEQPLVNAADSDDQAETAAAEAPVADGRMWRHRCVEVALATRRYFGLELGQEAGLTFSDLLTVTKKIERVYPNLLWAVNKGYARIVERLLARMTALSPPARPSLAGASVVASLVNYKWRNTIFPNYDYPDWFQTELYESIVRYNDSLLHVAARNGFTSIVQMLLAAGAAADPPAVDLETPLYFAARYGHVEVLKVLIGCKAAVDSVNTVGGTPFHRAVAEGQVEAAALLLSRGAAIEPLSCLCEVTSWAGLRQWEELADQRDHSGRTPLMIACERHNVDMVSPGGVERAANLSDALTLCLGLGNNGDLVALFPATLRGDGAATS